jgi:DNA-binding PadR family transcriptional regulator
LTNAELAILSLLGEAPGHGYDIESKIEARGMREWTEIGFSSIYAILKKLEARGWIEAEAVRSVGQGAPRKVYRITALGREAQSSAVISALSTPAQPNSSLLLGLSNLPIVPRDQALEALGQYASALEARLGQLLTRQDGQQPLPEFVQAMFDYSTAMIATELAWIDEYRQTLETSNG